MLSPFLKKLLFVRQFFINEGKIEILGQKQFMLPLSAISKLKQKETFSILQSEVQKSMESYAKKMGSSSGGMVKSVQDIYETMGLGKMKIIKLDQKKKQTVLRIANIKVSDTTVLEGVLSGLFSFLFQKKLGQENFVVQKKGAFIQITIK